MLSLMLLVDAVLKVYAVNDSPVDVPVDRIVLNNVKGAIWQLSQVDSLNLWQDNEDSQDIEQVSFKINKVLSSH